MNETLNENKIINQLQEEEVSALSWGGKLLKLNSVINTTKEVGFNSKSEINTNVQSKVFQTNQFGMVIVFIVCLLFVSFLLYQFFFSKDKMGIEFYFFATPFIIIFLWVAFNIRNQEFNYKIILTKEGIQIRNVNYNWKEIEHTFIILRYGQSGKGRIEFLILALKNGVLERFDITNFSGFKEIHYELAKYIEYYKHST